MNVSGTTEAINYVIVSGGYSMNVSGTTEAINYVIVSGGYPMTVSGTSGCRLFRAYW